MNVLLAWFRAATLLTNSRVHLAVILGLVLVQLLSPTGAARAQAAEGTAGGQLQPGDKPFVLPFKEPPGPDTWLLGQTYGNTVGAYFNRNTTYRYSQGIHFGIDLSAPCGTEIVPISDGDDLGAAGR